ncbi:unnamed protein product [Linum trigynum]|uniref:Reverse transcriptase zinc-binding domain-containing protein n=1 Tax=Linum trigynum TaxID=586398 RepID=A0AAV2DBF0_9ROSI
MKEVFWRFAQVEQGRGIWTSFWSDVWIEGRCLADEFPRVAAAAELPNSRVADILNFVGDRIFWDLPLKVNLRGGAERERVNLMNLLDSLPSSSFPAGPERLRWNPSPASGFSVKSMFQQLAIERFPREANFPHKVIWQQIVPSKVCIFMWMVYHKKIATVDNLKRKGWCLANRCALCEADEETVDHIFCQCNFAVEIWNILRNFVDIGDIRANVTDIAETLRTWPVSTPENSKQWCTRIALHAYCWTVWLERNSRTFNDEKIPQRVIVYKIGRAIHSWLTAGKKVDVFDAGTWLITMKNRLFPNTVFFGPA